MGEKKKEHELTAEELEEQNGEELPDREVMSLITPPAGADGARRSRFAPTVCWRVSGIG